MDIRRLFISLAFYSFFCFILFFLVSSSNFALFTRPITPLSIMRLDVGFHSSLQAIDYGKPRPNIKAPWLYDAFINPDGNMIYYLFHSKLAHKRNHIPTLAIGGKPSKCEFLDSTRSVIATTKGKITVCAHRNSLAGSCSIPDEIIGLDCHFVRIIHGRFSRELNLCRIKYPFPKPEFSLCAFVAGKDMTATWLKPWLKYHTAIGFNHVFVYLNDNVGSDAIETLSKDIDMPMVTFIPFYFPELTDKHDFTDQNIIEQNCLYRNKELSSWLAFLDTDEYFHPIHHNSVGDFTNYIETKKPNVAGIRLFPRKWRNATAPSIRPSVPPQECKYRVLDPKHDFGGQTKVIMKPSKVSHFSVHVLTTFSGAEYIAREDEATVEHFQHGCSAEYHREAIFSDQFSSLFSSIVSS